MTSNDSYLLHWGTSVCGLVSYFPGNCSYLCIITDLGAAQDSPTAAHFIKRSWAAARTDDNLQPDTAGTRDPHLLTQANLVYQKKYWFCLSNLISQAHVNFGLGRKLRLINLFINDLLKSAHSIPPVCLVPYSIQVWHLNLQRGADWTLKPLWV